MDQPCGCIIEVTKYDSEDFDPNFGLSDIKSHVPNH